MSRTVLLIEDNEQNLYLATFLLEHGGMTVIPARSGPEGIGIARTGPPDMIILDIQLPKMDGYAVARELRGIPGLDPVPIVAVTSYALAGDRERALEAGCNGYIEKPINPDTFLRQIEALLEAGTGLGGT